MDRLRVGRVSIPGALYFVTVCTERRGKGLVDRGLAICIRGALRELQREATLDLLCATIMPDHVHVLFRLGQRLSLSQSVAKLKRLTRAALEPEGLRWQGNFHDHRLDGDESAEDFSLYVFLNPYRKSLVRRDGTWPWWFVNRNYRPGFVELLDGGLFPQTEWFAAAIGAEELVERDRARIRKRERMRG